MPYAYVIWLSLFVFLPLIILWGWQYRILIRYLRVILLTMSGALVFAVPWDFIAIQQKIWVFTQPQVVGIWFLGLPIEEWLFISMVTAVFASVTVLLWERFGRRL